MKCARCANPLDDGALVCGQCGAVVGVSYGPPEKRPAMVIRAPSSATASSGQAPRLVDRVRAILRAPRREWPVIESEPTSALTIYTSYVAPLAAIGALALFASQVMIGEPVPFVGVVKAGMAAGLAAALLLFALALAHLYVLTLIVNGLARRFGGVPDALRALKVAAYSYTPLWLAGVLLLVPALSILWAIAAVWALYLAFVGLPLLMRCRPERAAGYALMAGACALGLSLFLGALVTVLIGFGPGLLG